MNIELRGLEFSLYAMGITKYFMQEDFLERSVTTRTGKGKTRDAETGWEASVLVAVRLTKGLE